MKITIIGSGNVGSALARALSTVNYDIIIGARNFDDEKVKRLLDFNKNISVESISNAVKMSDVIIIAAVPQAVREICSNLGDVKDKIIIDAMNSVRVKPEPFENTTEALKNWTNCENIVKCFNTTGAENMENPNYGNTKIDMFIAGNSLKGKEIASKLGTDIGFEKCYDFGGDDKFQLMEYFALSWINLAIMQKNGRDIAFKILHR
ncbi:MAG: NAD(P)-binding domain-containing protein [Candidatus Sericytochromatia bacterium]